jgi:hypothetical protein
MLRVFLPEGSAQIEARNLGHRQEWQSSQKGVLFSLSYNAAMRTPLLALIVIASVAAWSQDSSAPAELLTRAETSGFRATSTYEETIELLGKLAARSDSVKITDFGTSEQGRRLPLVIVSKDKAFTPSVAQRLAKPIVLLQSGIHAGEIDGKDATLMLLRELVQGQHPEILDTMTLLLVPIYNVDGHERVSRHNRSQQDGPEEGMGFRTIAGAWT